LDNNYDAVIVGGGIAGSSLAALLAGGGKSVLVLEKTEAYPDLVRGEWLAPWGVLEAKRAGLYEAITRAGRHHITWSVQYQEGVEPSDAPRMPFAGLLPDVPGPLSVGHPQACQALHDEAESRGACCLRGVTDVVVATGPAASVSYTHGGERQTARARVVVGADGRGSTVRQQAGVALHEDPMHHFLAGMLVDGVNDWLEDVQTVGTEGDVQFFVFPQGNGRIRLYLGYGPNQKSRFAGALSEQRFLQAFRLSSVPNSDAIAEGAVAGPCRSAPNQSTWTDAPAREGIVLIGDAAGYNDPIIGQGLSISLRDARLVGEALLGSDRWTPAVFADYEQERAERMRRLRFSAALVACLNAEFGPEPMARRLRFTARAAADPTFGLARAAAYVGPERLPAEAFTEAAWTTATNP
jgi:menaquinone-9 beta-reductase